jgi:DNA-binding XRE family transcriptional regulator
MESCHGDDFPQIHGKSVVPSARQWEMLKKLDASAITLDEFLSHWRLNKTQLAQVVGCDRKTVYRWFANDSEPSFEHQLRMALVHRLWSKT